MNFASFGELTIELVVGLISLLVATRFLGKTQVTQLTPFDFISALIMGELVGNLVYDADVGITELLFALFVWCGLILGVQFIGQRSIKARALLEGKPSIVIRKGILDREELKKNHMNINELQTLLRAKDVFSLREVEYAILEPNGSLSILKKAEFDTPTLKDLNLPLDSKSLATLLVSDGVILKNELKRLGKTESWLKNELKKQGYKDVENVFYAEWREEDGLYAGEKQATS